MAGQNNVHQFFVTRLEIGKHAQNFHCRLIQVLRLVDDHNDSPPSRRFLYQYAVELCLHVRQILTVTGNAKVREQVPKEIAGATQGLK